MYVSGHSILQSFNKNAHGHVQVKTQNCSITPPNALGCILWSSFLHTLTVSDLFPVPIILSFSEWHINRIIQYVAIEYFFLH